MRTLLACVLVACGGGAAGATSPTSGPPKENDYPYELNAMIDMTNQEDYAGAERFLKEHLDACLASKSCAYAARVLYKNWSIRYQNTGDWPSVRDTFKKCVETVHDAECQKQLEEVEARHQF